jgi:Ser/Thr protein kinase RdoA (MazF antagonist)
VPDVYVPIHGDAWDDQVLVGPTGPWLIDLDEMHLGHPLIDTGNVLAHLTAAGLEPAHDAFLEACGHSRIETMPFEALGLLRLAPRGIRNLRDDAIEEVEKHLRAALALLSEDPKLPQLPLVERAAHATLGTVERIEMVRHKAGRRAIFRIDTPKGRIYGKTFASGRGPKVYGILRAITEAQPFGDEVALPAPVAWIPEVKLLLQQGIPGETPDASLLRSRPEVMTQVALALARFHASGLYLGRVHLPAQELAPIAGRLDDVAAVDPALADRGRRVLAAIALDAFPWREQPIHRDCYHEQFVIDGARLGVLDLDDAAMGEPAVDIANMLAHLSLLEVQAGVDLGAARARFRHAAFAWDPGLDAALVDVLIAATCLRLAGIHVSRERGHAVATAMIAQAAAIVAVPA